MNSPRILISGAGIAGETLAYWLREQGCRPTVVERAPAPRAGGQAVDLRGAGRTVVERMGLLPAARDLRVQQRGIAWVDAAGRHRAEMGVEAFGGRGIVSADEILRGDLAGLLREAVGPEVEHLFDDTVTALAPSAAEVVVSFEQSATRTFDLVVGADGVHSVTRRLGFGDETSHLRPLGLLTAWFTVPAEVELDGWFCLHNAPGGRVVSLRPGRLPSEQKASLSARSTEDDTRRTSPAELLGRLFAGVGWAAPLLVRQARQAADLYLESVAQVRMERWSRGRVVLLGDAGYAPSLLTGLGTSLAVVGAYVLAGELGAAARQGFGDAAVQTALNRYEAVLRPYVEQAQALPPGGISGYAPRTRLEIGLGAWSMRSAQRWPMRPLLERVFAKADAIDLPDYEQSRADVI